MKNSLFLVTVFLFLASCSNQSRVNLDEGVLWKIQSKSGIVSYIFGTIHLYPKSEIQLSETVITKLQDCNILALESDLTNELEQKKFANFQMPEYFLDVYKIVNSKYGNDLISMEEQLIEKAQISNITISELESMDELISIMKAVKAINISDNVFIKENILSDYNKSLEMYRNESIDEIYESMTPQMGIEITQLLIDERNKNWIDNIKNLIEKESTFIAFGIGHLGGKNGVLHLLHKKGYILERVKI